MRQIFNQICLFALCALLAAPLSAAEENKKSDPQSKAVAKSFELPAQITLTDEQKTKLKEVRDEFEPKVKEVVQKQSEILTAEQKQTRREVIKSAKAAGKKGKDLQAEITAALKLTDEQKKKQEEVGKELKDLNAQIREKVSTFLTEEQKVHLKTKKKKTA